MLKEEEPIHQRLNLIIKQLESGVQRRFAQRVGVASGAIGDILGQRKSKPGFDLTGKILQAYPQLRARWLLLGEGEMLESVAVSTDPQNVSLYDSSAPASQAAELTPHSSSLGAHLVREPGIPARAGQRPILTYNSSTKMAAPPGSPPGSPPTEYAGMDLVRQVAANTAAIAQLRESIQALVQQQATKPS